MAVEVREPLTYEEHAPRSYFRDYVNAQLRKDPEAMERQARHAVEMRHARTPGVASETRDGAPIEYRTNPNTTLGLGGEFAPPLWLVDKYAIASSAGRPFADALQPMLLPPGVSSVHTPRVITGDAAGGQVDLEATYGQDFTTGDASSTVVTFAGEAIVSQQLLDLSPVTGGVDVAIYTDIMRAYNKALETSLLVGSPTGTQQPGQLLGIYYAIQNANLINGAAGSTSVSALWPLMGQGYAAVGNNRSHIPEMILMAPRRWAFIASSVDSSNRPIASPHDSGDPSGFPRLSGDMPAGRALGLPVYADGAIPGGTGVDVIYFLRPSDCLFWESRPYLISTAQPVSGTLQVRLSMHRYVAFIGNRYPAGSSALYGLTQPSGF